MALSRRGNRTGSGGRRRGGGRPPSGGSGGPPDEVPLPRSFRHWASQNRHPGLALDKFARSVDENGEPPAKLSQYIQRPTIDQVVRLTREFSASLYGRLLAKQRRLWETVRAVTFEGRTAGPLTLHLARASSLENAGIALHRIYGFPYLPAAGLKGLARAYAETVWFPTQFETDTDGRPADDEQRRQAEQAWRKIEAVFGWSPGSDRNKSYKPASIENPRADASVGAVVFHDAWCTQVPRLETDILNNHHASYYQGASPPGDWEDPVPVYFLTIAPNQTFQFALSPRRCGPDDRTTTGAELEQAYQWLVGGLATLGGGAKTNAGYGRFQFSGDGVDAAVVAEALRPWRTAEELGLRSVRRIELELTTPAFLAGAHQFGDKSASGCDLRPATLRGLLRWWWRTLHAGFLSTSQLQQLESAIFGDTEQAAALQLAVTPANDGGVNEFNFKDGFRPQARFKSRFGLADPPDQKTTQGLFYASYGMDDGRRDAPRRRYFRQPGQRWSVELIARPIRRNHRQTRIELSSQQVLDQASAALGLLCQYGGIGSRSHMGFGSLNWTSPSPPCATLDECRLAAAQLRAALNLPNKFTEARAESPALGDPRAGWLLTLRVPVPASNPWQIMDHIGFCYQRVAQEYKHQHTKLALGLPRQIHGPLRDRPLRHQDRRSWRPPRRLRGPRGDRHASPVVVHVAPADDGYVVEALAFPSASLPDLSASRSFLREFMKRFERYLRDFRPPSPGNRGGRHRPAAPSSHAGRSDSAAPNLPRPGDVVRAVLLEEKTNKGGWRARHPASGIRGPIVNTKETPGDWQAGMEVELKVHSANRREIAFRYVPR